MKVNNRFRLFVYDFLIFAFVELLLLFLYKSNEPLQMVDMFIQATLCFVIVFASRYFAGIYKQIWRYGGIQCYIRLLICDAIALVIYSVVESLLPIKHITFARLVAIVCVNLLGALAMRMMYRYSYKYASKETANGKLLNSLLIIFAGKRIEAEKKNEQHKTKLAIIGAGRVGVALAEELLTNESSNYRPMCFIDINKEKVNRQLHGLPVILEDENIFEYLDSHNIQEVVFALPNIEEVRKQQLHQRYLKQGYKIKVYDYPVMHQASGKRQLREFDIEDLLFRKPTVMINETTNAYYKDKVVLITGGGGSIGSELCRQLVNMNPKQIILVDIYENGVYNIQQEIKHLVDLQVEIVSITNKKGMERVFNTYHPQILINAAAHKHVPLMEHNVIEAIENNIFGTQVLLELSQQYNVERFMMVSTDKAVNPTNVMGATKRMCEMMVQSASQENQAIYTSTRFGNVLGSAGSVIPLFKKQIANGGPITLTDKRIIRYFMTIPEASQLVLQSGAMAKNGELFVLDMGQPVKIYDLAKNMIELSGVRNIEIKEIGLRPGEKLYEELLIKTEELTKTENHLIFIEKEQPLPQSVINAKLDILKKACLTQDDQLAKQALKQVVPTYKDPSEVNKEIKDKVNV